MFPEHAGDSSQEAGERESSNCTENVLPQQIAKSVSDESCIQTINTVSDVSGLQQSKKRMKHSPTEEQTVQVDAEIVTTKKKLSIKTDEVSGII